MFENIREDWLAHDCSWNRHGFWALVLYRFGRWRYTIRSRVIRLPFSGLYKLAEILRGDAAWNRTAVRGNDRQALVIEHTGAIVISGDAVFGDDCVIRQGVTVGLRHRKVSGSPRIGDRVDIGAGAKLLGSIRIGNDVAIGANAVVLCDVPDGCIAVGVPAMVKLRREQKAQVAMLVER